MKEKWKMKQWTRRDEPSFNKNKLSLMADEPGLKKCLAQKREREGRQTWKEDTGSYSTLHFVETVGHGNQAEMFAGNYVRHAAPH